MLVMLTMLWQLETAKKHLRAATWRARVFSKAGGAGDAGDVAEQAYELSCVNQIALAGSSSACRVSDAVRPLHCSVQCAVRPNSSSI